MHKLILLIYDKYQCNYFLLNTNCSQEFGCEKIVNIRKQTFSVIFYQNKKLINRYLSNIKKKV